MSNIREEPVLEALESGEFGPDHYWPSPHVDGHSVSTRRSYAHGSGVQNARSRRDSTNSQDNDNDIEYIVLQRVERFDQEASSRRQRVPRVENRTRSRMEGREIRRQLLLRRIRSVPAIETGPFDDPADDFDSPSIASGTYDDEVEAVTARTMESDAQTPVRSNSFRLPANTRSSSNASRGSGREGRFSGVAPLYDISSQIEAAMDDVRRLAGRPDWPLQAVSGSSPSHQTTTTTPLTQHSCYQFSDDDQDDEEDEEEEIDWSTRLQDAVFLLDDVDSSSEISQQFDDYDQYSDIVGLSSQDTQWVSSYEDL